MEDTCRNCKHWRQLGDEDGVCRRYPPVLDVLHAMEEIAKGGRDLDYAGMSIVWWEQPRTCEDTTCGEWSARSNAALPGGPHEQKTTTSA